MKKEKRDSEALFIRQKYDMPSWPVKGSLRYKDTLNCQLQKIIKYWVFSYFNKKIFFN